MLETTRWAQQTIGDEGLYAVALGDRDTGPVAHRRGLTWLVGMDTNDEPANDRERALLEGMRTR